MIAVTIFFSLIITFSHVKAESEVDLKGKVTLVTGAARGIGRSIADYLCQEDVEVVIIVDKNLTQGLVTESELKQKYGEEKVWFIHGDVTTDLEEIYKEVFNKYDYVDILINNAGILNEDDPVITFKTNMEAPILWSRKFYNVMRTDNGGKGGIILNTASVEAYTLDPFYRYYKAAKYGLHGFSMGLGHEWNLNATGVKVFDICPSYTETDLVRQLEGRGEPWELATLEKFLATLPRQSPDAVGQAVITILKTGTTGTSYTVKGGELYVSPPAEEVSFEFLSNL